MKKDVLGGRSPTRVAFALAAIVFAAAATAAGAGPNVTYSSVPGDVPGNVTSWSYESTSTTEAGDRIKFVPGTGGMIRSVTIILSSWGCEDGEGVTCKSRQNATFSHPITLNIYDSTGMPGGLIFSTTKTFKIPYRPSATPDKCAGGGWWDETDQACYNGMTTDVTFNLPRPGLNMPDTIVWGVAFNTTHYGVRPLGEGAHCYTESGGCGYDFLNLGADSLALIGTDVDPNGSFLNSSWNQAYCDGGAGATGAFRLNDGLSCWAAYRPMAEFIGATAKDCKKQGWKAFTNPSFASKAACIAFFDNLPDR